MLQRGCIAGATSSRRQEIGSQIGVWPAGEARSTAAGRVQLRLRLGGEDLSTAGNWTQLGARSPGVAGRRQGMVDGQALKRSHGGGARPSSNLRDAVLPVPTPSNKLQSVPPTCCLLQIQELHKSVPPCSCWSTLFSCLIERCSGFSHTVFHVLMAKCNYIGAKQCVGELATSSPLPLCISFPSF